MIVSIFSVTRKGTQSFATPQKQLINLTRLANPSFIDAYTTQLLYYGNQNITPGQGIQVKSALETIQNTLAGIADPEASVNRTPATINGVANTIPRTIRTGDLLYAIQNGSDVLWFIVNPNAIQTPLQYLFTGTTLEAEMVYWNNISSNNGMFGAFGACTTNTQAFTYDVSQPCTLYLEVQTGEAFERINTNTITVSAAGSASVTFQFATGDLILNKVMRVVAVKANGTEVEIVSKQFACTGGSASGSGTPTDCGEYSYFDGKQWDNTYKELNLGATCTTGYHVQVATSSDFASDKILYDIETTSTLVQLPEITAGTYYARTANLAGVTDWSAVLTFVVS